METNLPIDNILLKKAHSIGGLKTQKDTVELALEEFITKRETEKVIKMFHTVDYAPDYDYKKLRDRK